MLMRHQFQSRAALDPVVTGAYALLLAEADGLAADFTDNSMVIKDTVTPANNYNSAPFSKLTYSGASLRMHYGSDGILKYAPHNLLLRSQDFANAAWVAFETATKVGASPVAAPDGSMTAHEISFGATPTSAIYQIITGTGVINTLSCYVRAKTGSTTVRLAQGSGFTSDLAVTDSAWTRLEFAAFNDVTMSLRNNVAGNAGNVYVWGAQLEAGSIAQTYSPTTTAAYFGPRIDYDPATLAVRGFLVEEARTNLTLRSQEFDNAAWTNYDTLTVTANAIAAPDGTTTADKFVETAVTNNHFVRQTPTITAAVHTISIYAKQGERKVFLMYLHDGAIKGSAKFDLNLGTVQSTAAGTASIESVGNGWYRCIIVTALTVATGSALFDIFNCLDDGSDTYLGDVTKGIYFWGAQLEAGAFATSYIPTTTASVTRAADICSIATTLFNHSATLGTLYLQSTVMNAAAARTGLLFDDGTANELHNLGSSAGAAASYGVTDGGAAQAALTTGTVVVGTFDKMAAAWAAGDFALVKDGAAAATDAAGTLPTVTTLRIGTNQWVKQIEELPRRMSNAAMQTLTT